MRILPIEELMYLTRIELCDLARKICDELPSLPEVSSERIAGRVNLRNIRFVLARRGWLP